MNEAHEDNDFKFIKISFSSDVLIFGLKEQKTKKMVGIARVDLKKLYE
jgi:hypothetical protein